MPLRKSARSHSHVFPSDKSNMIEDYNGDDETVLSEEEDASAMDVDKKDITAEGKDGAIFIAKTFNIHSNGEKEYNPPQKFHIGKATPLPKDKKWESSGTKSSMKKTTLKRCMNLNFASIK